VGSGARRTMARKCGQRAQSMALGARSKRPCTSKVASPESSSFISTSSSVERSSRIVEGESSSGGRAAMGSKRTHELHRSAMSRTGPRPGNVHTHSPHGELSPDAVSDGHPSPASVVTVPAQPHTERVNGRHARVCWARRCGHACSAAAAISTRRGGARREHVRGARCTVGRHAPHAVVARIGNEEDAICVGSEPIGGMEGSLRAHTIRLPRRAAAGEDGDAALGRYLREGVPGSTRATPSQPQRRAEWCCVKCGACGLMCGGGVEGRRSRTSGRRRRRWWPRIRRRVNSTQCARRCRTASRAVSPPPLRSSTPAPTARRRARNCWSSRRRTARRWPHSRSQSRTDCRSKRGGRSRLCARPVRCLRVSSPRRRESPAGCGGCRSPPPASAARPPRTS
jgi:hypothetical protein